MMIAYAEQAVQNADQAQQAGNQGSALGGFMPIIFLIGIFVLMYVVMILPQKKKEKKQREMINAIVTGDSLTTIGGITGKVVTVKDDGIVIETGSDKTKITIQKWAIRDVTPKASEDQ